MSVAQKNHYTCDRCKDEEVIASDMEPQNWAEIQARYLDRKGTGTRGLTIRAGSLCSACRRSFEGWWTTP